MKIALVTRFNMPVRKEGTGYYSRMYFLSKILTEKGHEVTVLCHPESKVNTKIFPAKPQREGSPLDWSEQLLFYSKFISEIRNKDFDIVSFHADHMGCFFSEVIDIPCVNTIIYGDFDYDVQKILKAYKNQYFSTLSKAIKERYSFLPKLEVIPNGIKVEDFPFNERPDNYLLYLARIVPEKGTHLAIEAALSAGEKIVVAGPPNDKKYFEEVVKPLIAANPSVEYVGNADYRTKLRLFKNAKALLHPHVYYECFGVSMIESQACGTPVIAYPYGSTPEVVKNNETGFIVKNTEEMVEAIRKIDKIDRGVCRKFVVENFRVETMVDNYLAYYQKVISDSI